ncbi:MAG: hypothetical protein HZB56_00565 [Deltaproteobacteria bacterium]|nr:hypothetical protein [Deltaproteobacteria bacterium]
MPRSAPLPALLAGLACALATPALADDRFTDMARQAEPLDSLAGFVERYVGVCKDPLERAACLENVKAVRRGVDGKLYLAVLTEKASGLVRVENRRGGGFRFLVTPFIDADGLGLTHGEPRLDGQGRPAIGFIVLDAAPSVDTALVDAALRTGRVEMEILFRPAGTWRLKRRGERGDYEGMKARFAAVRLVDGRTGTEIAAKVLP